MKFIRHKIMSALKNPKRALKYFRKLISMSTSEGHCIICGRITTFYILGNNFRETFECKYCRSISRNRHLIKTMYNIFGFEKPWSLKRFIQQYGDLHIYEAQSFGSINTFLKKSDNYICSEYYHTIPIGMTSKNGVFSQDLQHLTFEDNSFEIVITQEVFEHIENYKKAFIEIYRVLKPGGCHLFTVPYSNKHKTQKRIKTVNNRPIFLKPMVYHGDSIRNGLVYTDFGSDLTQLINEIGFKTDIYISTEQDELNLKIYKTVTFVSVKLS